MGEKTLMMLTDQQLALLDGHVSVDDQAKVDAAMRRISESGLHADPKIARFLSDVRNEAVTHRKVMWNYTGLRSCDLCGKSAGYATYTRHTKYHRKGEPNHDRPLTMPGREMSKRFVSITGHAWLGGCCDCLDALLPDLREALRGILAELPDVLRTDQPEAKQFEYRRCLKCDWVGPECCMGALPAMMEGFYFGKCPNCKAEKKIFGEQLTTFVADRYVAVPHTMLKWSRSGQAIGLADGVTQDDVEAL